MRIITISREFGSGGREIGKRLADNLGIAYYDREIITAIANKNQLDENYVERELEKGVFRNIPLNFGRTFTYVPTMPHDISNLLIEQHKVIKELPAQGDCVIVGRNANIILEKYEPLKLFIYADMEAKMKRCRDREPDDEQLSDRELEKKIKQVDKVRSSYHGMITDIAWGDKSGYHLCVNTSNLDIKTLIPILERYVHYWFEMKR